MEIQKKVIFESKEDIEILRAVRELISRMSFDDRAKIVDENKAQKCAEFYEQTYEIEN